MTASRVHVRARDAVIDVEFDHPPINVYDVAMRDELCDVLTAVIANSEVRVVTFRATGDHFSAGADLREFGTAPSLHAMRHARWARDVWGLLRAVEVPMIAAMQGNAVGFGFELALQCDFRIAADDCVVALPEAHVGMIPAGGATQTLPRIVGTAQALRTVLTGARFEAADARRQGLVDEVVPRADLVARAEAVADALAERPASAVRGAKALVWAALDVPLAEGLAREQTAFARLPSPG
ncbi:MAG: enoyl-CoA hydratase/isomerase family protein [Acidimicrobiia bacterium]